MRESNHSMWQVEYNNCGILFTVSFLYFSLLVLFVRCQNANTWQNVWNDPWQSWKVCIVGTKCFSTPRMSNDRFFFSWRCWTIHLLWHLVLVSLVHSASPALCTDSWLPPDAKKWLHRLTPNSCQPQWQKSSLCFSVIIANKCFFHYPQGVVNRT